MVAHLTAPIAVESAMVAEPVSMVAAATETQASVSVPAVPEVPRQAETQPQPEKKGGFFKRLFGKF